MAEASSLSTSSFLQKAEPLCLFDVSYRNIEFQVFSNDNLLPVAYWAQFSEVLIDALISFWMEPDLRIRFLVPDKAYEAELRLLPKTPKITVAFTTLEDVLGNFRPFYEDLPAGPKRLLLGLLLAASSEDRLSLQIPLTSCPIKPFSKHDIRDYCMAANGVGGTYKISPEVGWDAPGLFDRDFSLQVMSRYGGREISIKALLAEAAYAELGLWANHAASHSEAPFTAESLAADWNALRDAPWEPPPWKVSTGPYFVRYPAELLRAPEIVLPRLYRALHR